MKRVVVWWNPENDDSHGEVQVDSRKEALETAEHIEARGPYETKIVTRR